MTKPSAEMYMGGGGVKVINWLGWGGVVLSTCMSNNLS